MLLGQPLRLRRCVVGASRRLRPYSCGETSLLGGRPMLLGQALRWTCWRVLAEAGFVIPPWSAGLQIRQQRGEGVVRPAHMAGLASVPLRSSVAFGSAGWRPMLLGQALRRAWWRVLAEAGFVIPPWSAGLQIRRQQNPEAARARRGGAAHAAGLASLSPDALRSCTSCRAPTMIIASSGHRPAQNLWAMIRPRGWQEPLLSGFQVQGRELQKTMVVGVGDIDVALLVQSDARGQVE